MWPLGIISLLLVNCAVNPPKFEPQDEFKPVDIEEKVAKKFTLRIDRLAEILEKVHKLKQPVPILLKRVGNSTEFNWDAEIPPDAEVIGYLVEEHNKIVAKIEQGRMMTEISALLVERIQVEVETYNALIEYAKLTQMTAERYRQLWINAENRVLQLESKMKQQRIEHKITLGIIGSALIAVVIAAL